jgi:hypothetical protein
MRSAARAPVCSPRAAVKGAAAALRLGARLSPTNEDQTTAAEKFERFTKRNLILVGVFFLASLITAIGSCITAVLGIRDWQRSNQDWRPAEYRKLTQLRAGQTFEKFKEALGAPSFRTRSPKGIISNVFHPRKEYWVDARVDESNTVLAYAVTSCSDRFNPYFRFRIGGNWARVTLNEGSFFNVLAAAKASINDARLQVLTRTATAPEYAFAIYGSGNPTSYRTYGWGLNDACTPWMPKQVDERLDRWGSWHKRHNGDTWGSKLQAADYRLLKSTSPNTYVETAPFTGIGTLYPEQIGVDRITIRP